MGEDTFELPEHCPPTASQEPEGTYFRYGRGDLVEGESLPEDDWVLPVNKRGPHYGKWEDCGAHALSIFRDRAVLLSARRVMPFARKKTIAQIELSPGMGSVLESESPVGPTHHDWWPARGSRAPSVVVDGRLA